MKQLNKLSSIIRGIALGAAVFASAPLANAANQYFDLNGATTGFGGAANGVYSWESTNWSTSSTGVAATTSWVPGNFPRFPVTATPYTVTLSAAESVAGIYCPSTGTETVTITNITSSGALSFVTGEQGMLCSSAVYIYAPITGPGAVIPESGNMFFYGTNTYSGGTGLDAGSVYINNNSSFGTGPIYYFGGSTYIIVATNSGPLTFANSFKATNGSDFIMITSPTNSVTFAGPWTNASATFTRVTVGNTSLPASTFGISGTMYGTGNFFKDGPGKLLFSGTNANSVSTTVTNGLFEITTSGLITGTVLVTNTAGILQLDSALNLNSAATLKITSTLSNSAVNLNYSGSDTITALYIDGVAQTSGTYGGPSSGAANVNNIFTGTGTITIPQTLPLVTQQPQPVAVFVNAASATFNVGVAGATPFTYQWRSNGVNIVGATSSSYTVSPIDTNSAATYSVAITNALGFAISSGATLTVLPTNLYTQTIVTDGPIAYYRLDELSGTNMLDDVSTNNGVYSNVTLGQPGFSLSDTDTSIGLPASTNSRGFGNVPSSPVFNFTSANSPFTFEAWASFTNLNGVQRFISKLGNGNGYAFGINGSTALRFTQGGSQDADIGVSNAVTSLSTGIWYHFVVTCDGFSAYTFYLNGISLGSVNIGGVGTVNNGVGTVSTSPLAIGADPAAYTFTPEQIMGNLDEVAIYGNQLSSGQVLAHYNARFGGASAPVVSAPVATPATNYVSLSVTLQSVAAGQNLSYQWYKSPSTLISGATGSSYTISPLALTDSGTYYVQVSNVAGTSNSPTVAVTVVPIPTNAASLNLTNALVVHLPFDGSDIDATGRGNNGTNVGSPTFVTPGAVGSNALHYSSAPGSFNYVTLGVRPDLQFSSNVDFTVSFWVREAAGTVITNLPFFSDAVKGTLLGFSFDPFATSTSSGGGWQWLLNNVSAPSSFTPGLAAADVNLINDGNWHNLTFVAQRSANLTTYLDGKSVDGQAINFLTSIDTATNANIGQDATGTYAVTAAADIDDLGVWRRTLSQFEISGLYLAGASNNVSFAPAASIVVPVSLVLTTSGSNIIISWSGPGTLQSSTTAGSGYTDVAGATSPYTVPNPAASQMFYRLRY